MKLGQVCTTKNEVNPLILNGISGMKSKLNSNATTQDAKRIPFFSFPYHQIL